MNRARRTGTLSPSEKQRRQKKLLLALSPVLLLLLVWQGPKTLSALRGGEAAPAEATPAATQAPASPAAAADERGATAPGHGPAGAAALPDTDDVPTAGPGQLVSFTRFVGKDPFRQQVSEPEAPTSEDVEAAPPATEAARQAPAGEDAEASSTWDADDEVAVLAVNGRRSELRVGASFPQGDGVFRLVSLTAGTARVGLVSGTFSTGKKTIALAPGERVVLENEANGVRYVVRFLRVAAR